MKEEKFKRRILVLFFIALTVVISLFACFIAETNICSETCSVTATETQEDGLHITLSDGNEYLASSVLSGLKQGEEVTLVTVEYIRGVSKTLINSEEVYTSKKSMNYSLLRTGLVVAFTMISRLWKYAVLLAFFVFMADFIHEFKDD